MTPEEQAIRDQLLAEAEAAAREFGAPPPLPPAAVPVPARAAPPSGDWLPPIVDDPGLVSRRAPVGLDVPARPAPRPMAAPSTAPQAMPQAMPPPIPDMPAIPERNVERTGSRAGRRAHAVFGGLLGALSGSDTDSFRTRVAAEEGEADQRYASDIAKYNAAMTQRQQAIGERQQAQKEGFLDSAIPDFQADRQGVPRGTTYRQLQTGLIPAGYFGLQKQTEQIAAQREAADAKAQLEDLRRKEDRGWELSDAERDQRYRLEQIVEGGRWKVRAEAAGRERQAIPNLDARAQQLTGLTQEEIDQAYKDKQRGRVNRLTDRLDRAIGDPDLGPGIKEANRKGEKLKQDARRESKAISDFHGKFARLESTIDHWRDFTGKYGPAERAAFVEELRGGLAGDLALDDNSPAKEMRETLRGMVSNFLGDQAGQAMSEGEASLYGGPAGQLFIDTTAAKPKWFNLDAAIERVERWVSRKGITPRDLEILVNDIQDAHKKREQAMYRDKSTRAVSLAAPLAIKTSRANRVFARALAQGEIAVPEGWQPGNAALIRDSDGVTYQIRNQKTGEIRTERWEP